MTRGKGYANGPAGLWRDTPEQPYVPAHELRIEEQVSPLLRPCPFCHAAPRQPCTRPGRGGRKPLRDNNHKSIYHSSRVDPSSEGTCR